MIPVIAAALAPIVSQLASNGLNLIASAVMAKGQQVVEDKLGVKLESSLQTEEGRIKLMQLQAEKEAELHQFILQQREQELKDAKMAYEDTASARDMNARIQESASADLWAKRAPYILDFIIVGSAVLLTFLVMNHQIPESNMNMTTIMMGSLWTLAITVVNFHRGSSKGSKDSGDTLRELIRQKGGNV